jgi:hypothetical protein
VTDMVKTPKVGSKIQPVIAARLSVFRKLFGNTLNGLICE